MHRRLLPLLRCPTCGSPLAAGAGGSVEIETGSLSCSNGHEFPIVGGVPRFTVERYAASFGYQWNRFSRTQLDSANGTTESRDTFLEKTGFRLEELRGKRVLEIGCGMGRFLEVVAGAGAEVVGIDISTAVNAAHANVGRRPNVDILQADVFSLPF